MRKNYPSKLIVLKNLLGFYKTRDAQTHLQQWYIEDRVIVIDEGHIVAHSMNEC